MMATNGVNIPGNEKTFFNSVLREFQKPVDGRIDTWQFLESSRDLVILIDKFGSLFSAIKYDMTGNIEKLTKSYNKNKDKYSSLTDMLLCEKAEGGTYATLSLQWLRRGHQFIHVFIECILADYQDGKRTEDLGPFLKKAYKEVLESYHNWMSKRLFSLLSRACPSRSSLMEIWSLGNASPEDAVMSSMRIYLDGLQSNMQLIIDFYLKHDLETYDKA